ncbi:MAG: DUF1552 domain-containing protein [Myxococcota bacterium]|nr:DUF1552 domain-containing protein [Myxococcota bacterium]
MKFSRRMFLGGAGALIALPLLESLVPRAARGAAPGDPPKRFVGFFVPNGMEMANWQPIGQGPDYTLPANAILAPLLPFRTKVLIPTGLNNVPARPDGVGDHGSGCGAFLTAVHVAKTEGADIRNGTSVDQLAAAHLGRNVRYRSLELGIEPGSSVGGCDSGYSCAYTRNISWANATTPNPKLTSSRVAFDRLFAGFDPDLTAAQIAKRLRYRTSVLDYAREDATTLRGKLGRTDQAKLDQYLTGVRELETRLALPSALCAPGAGPAGELAYVDHVKFMLDLIALSFACDQTRVATFMLGNAGSNRSHTHIGVADAHHDLSHHAGDPAKKAKLVTIDRWEVAQLAYLLARLEERKEVDGSSLLDHTIGFFSSEIQDGNSHSHNDLPIVVFGGAGGAITTGRHTAFGGRKVSELFVTMLQAVGAPVTSVGDGTGPLPGLLVA